MLARLALLLVVLAVCGTSAAQASSSRLVEWEIPLSAAAAGANLTATPDLANQPRRLAGYFRLNRTHDAYMFYFFFESRTLQKSDPVVLWMTGGPGCSSELAVFYENGPWHIKEDLSLEEAPYGWDASHNMIFVDQPINTGFSYSDDPRDRVYSEDKVADDMADFLAEFLAAHPGLAPRDFFVTGESYAGHYVPAVSARIHADNKAGTAAPINLKGFAIGNGLTEPGIQYGAYADFAEQNGLISQTARDRIKWTFPVCKLGIELCQGLDWSAECQLALAFCQATQFAPVMALVGNMNVYDIRKECEGPLCYDFSRLDRFINQPGVRKALGVGNRTWEACSASVHQDMMGDWMKGFSAIIQPMLEDGIRVMVYAGVDDFICNWLGNSWWVDALQWSGSGQWATTPELRWDVDGMEAGSVRAVGPLSFVQVLAAGHMVPMDQPKNALDMITRFTRNQPLAPASAAAALEARATAAAKLSRKETILAAA